MIHAKSMLVTRYGDIIAARRFAKDLAQEFGFSPKEQEEICLAVSELASNLIKHAASGILSMKPVVQHGRRGIEIVSEDDGPGFNFEEVLQDGVSSAGTLGCGLGAVYRLMDDVQYLPKHANGLGSRLACRKWLQQPVSRMAAKDCPLDIGVVTQPKAGQEENGDSYLVVHDGNTSLLSVIDGVGHGPSAHRAAEAAKQYMEAYGGSGSSLKDLFRGADQACHGTNGVVMALALFDWSNMGLTFASVGNIEAKIVNSHIKFDLLVRRGIVGRNAPAPAISKGHWRPGLGLVLHSDGISSRWKWEEYAQHCEKSALSIAEHMFSALRKQHDDATILVAK